MNKQLLWIERDDETKILRVGGMVRSPIESINMLITAIIGVIEEAPEERRASLKRGVIEAIEADGNGELEEVPSVIN